MKKLGIICLSVLFIAVGCDEKKETPKTTQPTVKKEIKKTEPMKTVKKEKPKKVEVKKIENPVVDKALKIGLPSPVIPNNLGMQLKTEYCETKDINAIGKLGAKLVRRGFYWNKIETVKGKYDFSHYDRILKDCEANEMMMLGCLFGGNKLYENDKKGGIQTEKGRQGFAKFAAACAKHYKGKEVMFEIWNEPNVRTFWNRKGKHNSENFADEYTKLCQAAVPAMKKENPNVVVFAGSVSCFWKPSFNWTNHCFAKGMYKTGISGWSVHPYGLKNPEQFTEGYKTMRDILKKHGVPSDFPMVNTERGFAAEKYVPRGGTANDEGWSGGPKEWADQYQAWFVVRQYLIDQMNGIGFTIWYEWGKKKFGLIVNGKKKPAYHSCKTMIEQLSGYTFKEKLPAKNELDYLLVFENDKGAQKLVAWTSYNVKKKETPDKTKKHTIQVPVSVTGKLAHADIYGKESTIEVKDGKLSIKITGAPQYITLKK